MSITRPAAPHTPAPWTVDPPQAKGPSLCYPIREKDGYLIATVWPDDSGRERADADLIAAAPELFAACEKLCAVFRHGGPDGECDRREVIESILCDVLPLARAAVARAKPRS